MDNVFLFFQALLFTPEQVNYRLPDDDPLAEKDRISDPDVIPLEGDSSSSDEENNDEVLEKDDLVSGKRPQISKKPRVSLEPVQPVQTVQPVHPVHIPTFSPVVEGVGTNLKVLGFNQKQRQTFLTLMYRFGLGDLSWKEYYHRLKPKTPKEIKEYATLFFSHLAEPQTESPSFFDGVPKEGMRVSEILQRIGLLHLVREKVEFAALHPNEPLFSLFASDVQKLGLREGAFWKKSHDIQLLKGVLIHGHGRWQDTVSDVSLDYQEALRKELILQPPPVNFMGRIPTSFPGAPQGPVEGTGNPAGQTNLPEVHVVIPGGAHLKHNEWSAEIYANKKMTEFVKKRLTVLFKALGLESQRNSKVKASSLGDLRPFFF